MDSIRQLVMFICMYSLALILGGVGVWYVLRLLTPMMEWVRSHVGQAAFVAPFVVCLCYVGMTKHGNVIYPYTDVETRYLIDSGSFVTNDYVHVSFVRSPVVPDSANLYGAVRPSGSTNDEEWVEFLETTFASFNNPTNIQYVGALTNDFAFYTDFTPGPIVHTNGVAIVNWQRDFAGGSNNLATIRTGIYCDGSRVAPNPAITNGPPVIMFNLTTGVNENE